MTSSVKQAHVCIDCIKRAKEPGAKPFRVRPIVTMPGQPPRCHTDRNKFVQRRRRNLHSARIRRVYKIDPEDYWAMYDEQGGTCAIAGCDATGERKLLAVDHEHHKPGCEHPPEEGCRNCIRGLLCGPHNKEMIGRFGKTLQAGLDYLADPPGPRVLLGGIEFIDA